MKLAHSILLSGVAISAMTLGAAPAMAQAADTAAAAAPAR